MESLQDLKSRIRSVKNVGQITKAMEVVAATRMRRSQEVALASRAYAYKSLELLARLVSSLPSNHSLMNAPEGKPELLVIVSSDRGLAGSFNALVERAAQNYMRTHTIGGCIVVGKRAHAFAKRQNIPVVAAFEQMGDVVNFRDAEPIAEHIFSAHASGEWSRIVVISMYFRTALLQEPVTRTLLPATLESLAANVKDLAPKHGKFADMAPVIEMSSGEIGYIHEPSREDIASRLVAQIVRMQVGHILLEANASEHSARRAAMSAASENASELADTLSLQFNKARQSNITRELVEITATTAALTS